MAKMNRLLRLITISLFLVVKISVVATANNGTNQHHPQCMIRRTFNFKYAWRLALAKEARIKAADERRRQEAEREREEAERRRQEIRDQKERYEKWKEEQQQKRQKREEENRKRDQQQQKRQKQEEENRKRDHQRRRKESNRTNDKKDCPYKILGVATDASQAEIKQAYRKLSLKYHPDKNRGSDESKEIFTKLVDAYEILGDTDSRTMYDNETFGAYESRPRNYNSKAGFYGGATSLISPLNQTEFERLVQCEGPFHAEEECVPWMVKFYTPWCVHCKNLIPTWKRAASAMDGTETPLGFVRFGAVNCETDRRLCNQHAIKGYPTIHLYARDAKGQDHIEKYPLQSSKTVDKLIDHAVKGIRLTHESTLQTIDSFIMEKNVTNSESTGLWIVMFEGYSMSRGNSLKASLRRMSANMNGLANFGVFHCGKEPKVCEQQYIGKKFPVLRMYPYKGSKGTGETLLERDDDPHAVLPIVEKVVRMCIENIETENGLMKTLHEDFEEEEEEESAPPRVQYEYPKPEPPVRYVLPDGVRASGGGRFISGGNA